MVAVCAQRAEKVKRYVEDTGLPFNILIDDSRDVLRAYGVWHSIGLDAWNIARPSLFVIAQDRTIQSIFVADWQWEFPSPEEIANEVARLSDRSGAAGGPPTGRPVEPGVE